MTKSISLTLTVAAAVLSGLSGRADEIAYDNTTTSQKDGGGNILFHSYATSPTGEIGDEIQLLGGANTITRFQFEYRYNGAVGPATGVLRFYDVFDVAGGGTRPDESDVLLVSNPFTLNGNGAPGFGTVDTGPISVTLPPEHNGRFVWTVTFSGVAGADQAGLVFYNATGPTVGTSDGLHWERIAGGGWSLFDDALGIDNFNARVTVVPEPGTVALMAAGGIALFAAARRRKA